MPALSCLQEEKHRSGLRSPLALKALDIAFGSAEDKSQWANCWYIHCRLVFVLSCCASSYFYSAALFWLEARKQRSPPKFQATQKEHLVLHQTFGLFTTHTGKTT